MFINAVISFLLVALAMFILIRAINRLKRRKGAEEAADPTIKDCPYCLSTIPLRASRCPQCTSQLDQD